MFTCGTDPHFPSFLPNCPEGHACFCKGGCLSELARVNQLLVTGTNNIAKYRAGIEGLMAAKDRGALEIQLLMDSQLVVEQINGRYKVTTEALKVLRAEILELLKAFDWHAVAHVPREDNQRADELANLAYEIPTPE
jgi:ribonuclease HI